MANFRGHLTFSAALGATYGGLLWWQLGCDWGSSILAAGITGVGGMMPDLDSDNSIPVREMFGFAGVILPLLFLRRLVHMGLQPEQILVVLGAMFLCIRYGVSNIFKRLTVHRGMFHSVPAMLIAGLLTFLVYHHPQLFPRLVLAGGVMMGFFSHLLLDEIYAVDFRGFKPKMNQFAGSALKFSSRSHLATGLTYLLLFVLSGLAFLDVQPKQTPVELANQADTGRNTGSGHPPMNLPKPQGIR